MCREARRGCFYRGVVYISDRGYGREEEEERHKRDEKVVLVRVSSKCILAPGGLVGLVLVGGIEGVETSLAELSEVLLEVDGFEFEIGRIIARGQKLVHLLILIEERGLDTSSLGFLDEFNNRVVIAVGNMRIKDNHKSGRIWRRSSLLHLGIGRSDIVIETQLEKAVQLDVPLLCVGTQGTLSGRILSRCHSRQ